MRSEAGTLLSSQGQRLAPPTRRKPGVFTSHSGFALSRGDSCYFVGKMLSF